jgi:predicted ATPase
VLVAAGKSNRAIADELFLSERTVENHVAGIYARLEVRSRVELTAIMVRLAYAAPAAGMSNLPVPLTSFVGRDRELADIIAFLETQRLVTLAGSGGIGKTRLALQVGAKTTISWPGGMSLIDLSEAKDELGVAAALHSTLSPGARTDLGTADGPESFGSAIAVLKSRQKTLLILDNCEQVRASVSAFVGRVLDDCANVSILATSRQPLGLACEQIYLMPSLDVPDPRDWPSLSIEGARAYSSVSLFLDRSASANHHLAVSDAQIPVICEIVSRLDGIALAIELAASCCNMLQLPEINRRLDKRFELLTRGTTALRHQRTLRATIDWSYELLSEEERLLWRRLVFFSGGFTVDAVESVCTDDTLPREDVLDLLKSLVAQSLLTVDFASERTRYRFLESTRSYLLELAWPDEERNRLARRHAEWVAARVTQLVERRDRVHDLVQALRGDLDNIRAAIEWGFQPQGDVRISGFIIAELRDFWFAAGLHGETRTWAQAILDILSEDRDPDIVAGLWLTFASVSSARSRVAAAERATRLFEQQGDVQGLASSFFHLAWGHVQTGSLDEAATAIEKSLRYYRDAGMQNTWPYAQALTQRGDVLRLQHHFTEARAFYDQALRLYRLLRDEVLELWTMISLGEWEFAVGNVPAAIDVATGGLTIAERRRAVAEAALLLCNRAGYHLAIDELPEVRSDAVASLALARSINFEYTIPNAMQHLAAVYARGADPHRSALIAGYVDDWYRREASVMEPVERASHDILSAELHKHFSEGELDQLLSIGAGLTEQQALSEVDMLLARSND